MRAYKGLAHAIAACVVLQAAWIAASGFRVAKTTDEPTGGPGGNSAFRLAAVHDRFAVPAATAPGLPGLTGPVLLVDDLVDSRWTVTVVGALLRQAGAPGVLPFALAAAA